MKKHFIIASAALAASVLTAAAQTATTPTTTTPTATTPTTTTTAAGSATTQQAATDIRGSMMVGSTVYNSANENIGEVNDIIVDGSGKVTAVVVGVGGFLGMGEKNVAMPFESVKRTRDEGGTLKLTVDGTKDSLKSMPSYTYLKS